MMKDNLLDEKEFKRELVQTIKVVDGRFDDSSLLSKIKQILLHWLYELV